MAVGIDLNYFFSWPLVLFIFATLRPTRSISKLNANMVLPREVFSRYIWLWVTNYDLSNACHTLGRPIQANPTTNPSKPQRPIQANPTTNPTTANPNDGPPESKRQGQNTMYGLRMLEVAHIPPHYASLWIRWQLKVPHDASTPQLLMGAMQSPSTSDAYYNHASQLLDAMQPRINFHDATILYATLSKSSTAVSLHDCYLFVHLF